MKNVRTLRGDFFWLKLYNTFIHSFHLAYVQCDRMVRNVMLGQQPKGVAVICITNSYKFYPSSKNNINYVKTETCTSTHWQFFTQRAANSNKLGMSVTSAHCTTVVGVSTANGLWDTSMLLSVSRSKSPGRVFSWFTLAENCIRRLSLPMPDGRLVRLFRSNLNTTSIDRLYAAGSSVWSWLSDKSRCAIDDRKLPVNIVVGKLDKWFFASLSSARLGREFQSSGKTEIWLSERSREMSFDSFMIRESIFRRRQPFTHNVSSDGGKDVVIG